jgi:hypothetical protein
MRMVQVTNLVMEKGYDWKHVFMLIVVITMVQITKLVAEKDLGSRLMRGSPSASSSYIAKVITRIPPHSPLP